MLNNNPGCDLVIDFKDGLGLQRVQVKKCYCTSRDGNSYRVFQNGSVRYGGFKLYTKEDYDCLVAVDLETSGLWRFPAGVLAGKKSVLDNLTGRKYFRKGCVAWDDYRL